MPILEDNIINSSQKENENLISNKKGSSEKNENNKYDKIPTISNDDYNTSSR